MSDGPIREGETNVTDTFEALGDRVEDLQERERDDQPDEEERELDEPRQWCVVARYHSKHSDKHRDRVLDGSSYTLRS